jgi:DNA-binding transcriptional LysR family regulator
MRLRLPGAAKNVQIRVDEKDYPDIVKALREGRYPYAIGWELGADWYHDLRMNECLYDAVPFGVILGHPKVRGTEDDELARLFGVQEEMRWLEQRAAGQEESKGAAGPDWGAISISDLERKLLRSTVAVLKNEYDKKLERLTSRVRGKLLRVEHYEDIISSVRMGIADLGWGVPAFFLDRRDLHFRLLTAKDDNGPELPVTRRVVVYRHTVKDRKPQPAAESLLETVKRFLQEEKFVGGDTTTWAGLSNSMVGGKRITPQEIETWVNREWGPKEA